jgi:hypothetical protein
MKLVRIVMLFVLGIASVSMFAQDKPEDAKPAEAAKPAKQQEAAKPEKQEKPVAAKQEKAPKAEKQQHTDNQQQKATAKQEKATAKQQKETAKQEGSTSKAEQKDAQHNERAAKGQQGQQHGRIPDDKFKAHFGESHHFHVNESDYRNHRFQYGGYNFGFVGVWPSDWLYTQDVYVCELGDVYYLCNPMYPGVTVELEIQ